MPMWHGDFVVTASLRFLVALSLGWLLDVRWMPPFDPEAKQPNVVQVLFEVVVQVGVLALCEQLCNAMTPTHWRFKADVGAAGVSLALFVTQKNLLRKSQFILDRMGGAARQF